MGPRLNIITISDPADERIAAYHDIRDRDLHLRDQSFIAEGKVVLRVLFASKRWTVRSALILENRLEGMRDILASAPAELPVFVASQDVLDRIAGFHLHRGVLALVERPASTSAETLLGALPTEACIVVLVGISNHDNVGAIFRNAAAFCADAVLLDDTSCDPLYRKALRVSVGAVLSVPFARAGNARELPELLLRHGFTPFALSPVGTISIGNATPARRTALLLGTEGEGLPTELLGRMQTVRIPMADNFDSLNVAAASAVAMHRLGRFRV